MDRLKFYRYATFFLLALNLGMVAFFLVTAPPHRQADAAHHGFKEHATALLQLDDRQQARFEALASAHNQHMDSLAQRQRLLLKDYFLTLTDSASHAPADSLLRAYLVLEGEKVTYTYRHFEDVRHLLRPDQLPRYETFVKGALQVLLLDADTAPPPAPER